jgi:hypothetical protein
MKLNGIDTIYGVVGIPVTDLAACFCGVRPIDPVNEVEIVC